MLFFESFKLLIIVPYCKNQKLVWETSDRRATIAYVSALDLSVLNIRSTFDIGHVKVIFVSSSEHF